MHEVPGRNGQVTIEKCRSQLLYGIQGKRYYNSDVVAIIDQIQFELTAPNAVYVHNIKWDKPPAATKVGITAKGGFQAEVHYFAVGLDIEEKAALPERQLQYYLDDCPLLPVQSKSPSQAVPNPNRHLKTKLLSTFESFPRRKTKTIYHQTSSYAPAGT
ncbi:hypothetical protein N7532_008109 [Penicillium argentinense]|uniref:Acyclic terpene utilisation N-terminal domain-containing protein n=1 Tax=Penicillium argentinense TaxID=1131581 RepID=A0A9W9EX16_9EURO|nr:uncharacterized protein N7532_008109 [Penicillium argentinense]KAJ5089425.1 hypothetical protein N7532_008109 [Penicillium argentinense]